jgi:hypothetical protein
MDSMDLANSKQGPAGVSSVTLRYVHAEAAPDPALSQRLLGLRERYGERVQLQFVANSGGLSTLYVLRGEAIVSQAAGRDLPVRELNRVVDCALEWPH